MERSPFNNIETSSALDDATDPEQQTSQSAAESDVESAAASGAEIRVSNESHGLYNNNEPLHEPGPELRRTNSSQVGEGPSVPTTIVIRKEPVIYKIVNKPVFLRKDETHLMKRKARNPKRKLENESFDEGTKSFCLNINDAMMKEEAAQKLRAQQEEENNASLQKTKAEVSLAGNIENVPKLSLPSSSRPHEKDGDSTAAVPVVSNLEPEIVEADSSTSSPLDDFVPPLQELIGSHAGELYVQSYRISNYRKFSTEEFALPRRDIMNTLDLDRDSNDYCAIQDLPNITTDRIALALRKAEEEFYKELAGEQDNAANNAVPQRAMKKEDDKAGVQKAPGENNVAPDAMPNEKMMKESKEAEEADQQEKDDEEEEKKPGCSTHHKENKPE